MEREGRNYRLRLGLPEITKPYLGNWLSSSDRDFSLQDLGDSSFQLDQPSLGSWLVINDNPRADILPHRVESPQEPYLPLQATRPDTPASVSSDISYHEDMKSNGKLCKGALTVRESTVDYEGGTYTSSTEHRYTDEVSVSESAEEFPDRQEQETNESLERKFSELWLHAGTLPEGRPQLRQWEVSHELERMLQQMSLPEALDEVDLGRRVWRSGCLLSDLGDAEEQFIMTTPSLASSILETDLVRAALYALQGVPAAVSWLQQLAASFTSTAADRSSHNLHTLWIRSSSTVALGKVLTEFAKAGRVAYQLEAFVSFFLDEKAGSYLGRTGSPETMTGGKGTEVINKRKRKRQHSEAYYDTLPSAQEDLEGQEISPHCLVNQAYAAAVRTMMQGNLASLNTLGASVSYRRQQAVSGAIKGNCKPIPKEKERQEEDAGLVFTFGCGDITLLELYLHTSRLREQLQVLAAVCRIEEVAACVKHFSSELEQHDVSEAVDEDGWVNHPGSMLQFCAKNNAVQRKFEMFPRGAELLTYLYNKLSEADPLHMELLRFLFERTCQPYAVFIRSWLYHATVQDPFHEFIVKPMPPISPNNPFRKTSEQAAFSTFQVRKGVTVPCFLEDVCMPLLRAGQQLQVLSKLLETRQFASHMANFPLASTGGQQDPSISPITLLSDFMGDKSTLRGSVFHFSKKKLLGAMELREIRGKVMKDRFDRLFADLASLRSPHNEVVDSKEGQELMLSVVNNRLLFKMRNERERQSRIARERPPKASGKLPPGRLALAALRVDEPQDDISAVSHNRSKSNEESPDVADTPPAVKEAKSRTGGFLKSTHQEDFQAINSKTKMSLISDFRMGTSWPLWGLPINPFLAYINNKETSSHYKLTTFHPRNRHWDLAMHWGNPLRLSDSQNIFFEGSEHVSKAEQRLDEEPVWFTKLEESFRGQLFRGLDEMILQEKFESLGYEFERGDGGHWSPYSVGWGHSTCIRNFNAAIKKNIGRRLQPNPEGEVIDTSTVDAFGNRYFVEDCITPKTPIISNSVTKGQDETSSIAEVTPISSPKTETVSITIDLLQTEDIGDQGTSLEERVQVSNVLMENASVQSYDDIYEEKVLLEETETMNSSENMTSTSDAGRPGRGANWETYLDYKNQQHEKEEVLYEAVVSGDDDDSKEEIPLVVVVTESIVQEILSQYQYASMFTVRLLQEGLCLQDHYSALRRYYFMERGDWAEYFLTALCKHKWNRVGAQPRLLEVQSLLEIALQNSSCEGDEYAERLHIYIHNTPDDHPLSLLHTLPGISHRLRLPGTFVTCNRLDAFDFIKVGYKVDWPLSLVLTPSALNLYNSVFTFLIRTKLTIHALADIWCYLQAIGRSLDKARRSADYQHQMEKLRTLQLFRQQVGHVVTTVQRYGESQLLHVVWSRFHDSVQHQVKDIHDLEEVHTAYLKDACHQCFLSKDMEGVKACVDNIMQCTLDFREHLSTANHHLNNSPDLINNDMFDRVLAVKVAFEASLWELYSFHQRPEPQYRILLNDFWMYLDFNGFLTRFNHDFSLKKPSLGSIQDELLR